MLIRALIVLLLVLNLGVALWWAVRTPPGPPASAGPPPGVARLQAVDLSAPAAAAVPRDSAPARVDRCLSLGPFAEAAAAERARAQLRPHALQLRQRRGFSGTPDAWSVLLPPFASAAEAEAAARAIAAAGFEDYFVMREGARANAVGLGLYNNERSARQRVERLTAAGFPAELEPTGAGPAQYWLDLAVPADFDAERVRALSGGDAGFRPLDCGDLQPVP